MPCSCTLEMQPCMTSTVCSAIFRKVGALMPGEGPRHSTWDAPKYHHKSIARSCMSTRTCVLRADGPAQGRVGEREAQG